MLLSFARNSKRLKMFWRKKLADLESEHGQSHSADIFISFDSMDGCAKAIVAKAKEAGLIMTGAGATFPYGKDPKDSNIRIAPSFPTVEELAQASEIFVRQCKTCQRRETAWSKIR